MDLFGFVKRFFGKKAQPEALQSASKRSEALQQRSEALESGPEYLEKESSTISDESAPSIELEKDSVQLGIAAGYTGRALRDIESSMNRIESQMTTKDWFDIKFGPQLQELIEFLKQHEKQDQLRFEALQSVILSLSGLAEQAPKDIKAKLYEQINVIESQLPLTPKMTEAVHIIKSQGEISYDDLAKRLNLVNISSLRGLLSNMLKRTKEIERFEKDGKGWVRYKS